MSDGYLLELSPHARRSLDKIPKDQFQKIDHALIGLKSEPRPYGVKKLRGDIHRIRIGDWRIIYVIVDRHRRVSVLDVVRRSESTYR